MNDQIFVSYRREDASYPAGRPYDNLHSRFPQNEIFMDVDSIKPGVRGLEAAHKLFPNHLKSVGEGRGTGKADTPKDVFISCKILDEHGVQTRDSEIATEVYNFLTGKGLSVFFSTFTLEQLGVADYSMEIDSALESATVLLAIGTSADHLYSEWVRYERDSFSNAIRSGSKPNGRVFTYIEGMPIRALPWALRQTQTFVHSEASLQRLYNFINKALSPSAEQREREKNDLAERPVRPPEGPQTPRGPAPGQDQPELLPGLGAGSGAPAPDRTPLKEVTANLKRPRQLLVVTGIGIVVCLLGFGLFKATRPQPVSIGGSSSPTPVPLAAASNPPSPTPSVRQASPSPTPSGADPLAEAKQYLDVEKYPQALPPLRQAAKAGNAEAMYCLAELYYRGNGVPRNYAQAGEGYLNAAWAGYPEAMYDYAYMLENGQGMAQDHVQARQWFQKAAGAGNEKAKKWLQTHPSLILLDEPTP